MKLSILKNATPGCTTYYVGNDINHTKHLRDCVLICKPGFDPQNDRVKIVHEENPQLYFYKLSHKIDNEYTFINSPKVGKNVSIGVGCVIGDGVEIEDDVEIGPNTVIYSKTKICAGTRIGANVTIGAEGMMWVWDGDEKVFLKQLGGVIIGRNCVIGSNSAIVRGSANELTIIEDNTNLSPGCNIGHGTYIGKNCHLANNVTIGGSVYISSNSFIGCAGVVNPGIKLESINTIIGAGGVVSKHINESGIYVGVPVRKINDVRQTQKGIPNWNIS
jgi:UDP-3-O-[3-hydroxymyristoyl] glucosamine N-acyltransferase